MRLLSILACIMMFSSVAMATPIVLYDNNNQELGTSTNPVKVSFGTGDQYISGNLGIGSSSPRGKLDVAGKIYSSSDIISYSTLASVGQTPVDIDDIYASNGIPGLMVSAGVGGRSIKSTGGYGGQGGDNLITAGRGGYVDTAIYGVGGIGGNNLIYAGDGGSALGTGSNISGNGGYVEISGGYAGLAQNGTSNVFGRGGNVYIHGGVDNSVYGSADVYLSASPTLPMPGAVVIGTTSPNLDTFSRKYVVDVQTNFNASRGFSLRNISTGTSASSRFLVTNSLGETSGYVGISYYGTNLTSSAFGVTLANYASIYNSGSSTNGLIIGTGVSKPIILGINNTEKMRIDSTGNIGIGTTSPQAGFEVDTSIYLKSTVVTRGYGMCVASTGILGHCTSVLAADGTCTCVAN